MADLSEPRTGALGDPDTGAESRRIAGQGTPERAWQAWPALAQLPALTAGELVPRGRRVIVVAPHPDDELLGCGGLLAQLARDGREIVVIGVTDGEASHPGSARFEPGQLARTRSGERRAGLERLGLDRDCVRLGWPDGGIAGDEPALAKSLGALLRPADVVLATWRLDGHPDHEAVGRAAASAARTVGATFHEMPVWMWHWAAPGDGRVPWARLRRVALDADARDRKRGAVAAHASQIEPDGSRPPVLPDWALARVLRPVEYFFIDPDARDPVGAGASPSTCTETGS